MAVIILISAIQELPNRCKTSQGAKKPLLPPQKKILGSHSSSWSNNRKENGKYKYTMPGVSGATHLHEKEKPHSKADFLIDLNCQLKKRFETTPPATGSSRIAKPLGTKPPMCPARLPFQAELLPRARWPTLERQTPPARPTPPPKPTQTTTVAKGQ